MKLILQHLEQLIREGEIFPDATIKQGMLKRLSLLYADAAAAESITLVEPLVRIAMIFLQLSNNLRSCSADGRRQLQTFLQEAIRNIEDHIAAVDESIGYNIGQDESANDNKFKPLVLLIFILLSGVCVLLSYRFDFKLNNDLIKLFELLADVFYEIRIDSPESLANYIVSLHNCMPGHDENSDSDVMVLDLIGLSSSLIKNHSALKADRMLNSFSMRFHNAINIISSKQLESSTARLKIISNRRESTFVRLDLLASAYRSVVRHFSTGTNHHVVGISREGAAFFSAIQSYLSSLDLWDISSIEKRCMELIEMERFPIEYLNKLRDSALIWFDNKEYSSLLRVELPTLVVLFASMGKKETLSYFDAVMSRINADVWDDFRVYCLHKQAPFQISPALLNLNYVKLSDRFSAGQQGQQGQAKFSQYLAMAIRVTTYLDRLGLSPPSPLRLLLTGRCPSYKQMFNARPPISLSPLPTLSAMFFAQRQQQQRYLLASTNEGNVDCVNAESKQNRALVTLV